MIVPLFIIMNKLGLLNTYLVLFLPIINAFGVFLTRQFIVAVPDELLESARIDGAGEFTVFFFRIVIPMVKPVAVSLTIFHLHHDVERLHLAVDHRHGTGYVHVDGRVVPLAEQLRHELRTHHGRGQRSCLYRPLRSTWRFRSSLSTASRYTD